MTVGSFGRRAATLVTGALGRLRPRPPRGVILLYHRIANLERYPWGLAVTPAHFAEHLATLRRIATPVALAELIPALVAPGASRPVVAVTFDDGYADNLHAAVPLLERFAIPATFFVTVGIVEDGGEFWWDRLEQVVFGAEELPTSLALRTGSGSLTWSRPTGVAESIEHASWRAWDEPPTARHALYLRLYDLLKEAGDDDRRRILDELVAGSRMGDAAPDRLLLDTDGLAALASHPLAEIGAHTVTHASLSGLPAARQEEEIVEAKSALERLNGASVVSFAYPFGKQTDFTPETTALVRRAGYARACTAMAGVVGPTCDPFVLPRLGIPDCDGGALARMLDGLLSRARASARFWPSAAIVTRRGASPSARGAPSAPGSSARRRRTGRG